METCREVLYKNHVLSFRRQEKSLGVRLKKISPGVEMTEMWYKGVFIPKCLQELKMDC